LSLGDGYPEVKPRTNVQRRWPEVGLWEVIDNGEIRECPHCGKSGLLEEVDGKNWYTHSQIVGFDSRGSPEMSWDMCPQPVLPKLKTPE
jgi:hypothetical protein